MTHDNRKTLCCFFVASLLGIALTSSPVGAAEDAPTAIDIVVPGGATPAETTAAEELAKHLRALYPKAAFPVVERATAAEAAVYIGTPESAPMLMHHLGTRQLAGPESYVVTKATIDGRPSGLIVGADPAGVAYGVYGLLKRLGCGFYLSFDTLPGAKDAPFSFDGWDLADRPLVPTRMVFNWHNFLSGCSTWRVEDWKSWTRQSQKMGYNTIMVHAYGNNPMAGFSFQGKQKPVGYLSSTRVGRDWSTNHVNDVRRLWGGSVFSEPVFGCSAAIDGTDGQRTRAAQQLMQPVFAEAEQRGVNVYFAVDVDTTSANPPPLIEALDANERFQTGGGWLARPDTPGGYALYLAQVKELLQVYPQIDCLVVWHRTGGTPWMSFRREEMPQAWQDEYAELCRKDPSLEDLWHSVHLFAQAKIVAAFQRAVAELGRTDVKIAFGSWNFSFMAAADRFVPPQIELIGLDYDVLNDHSIFDSEEGRSDLARIAGRRSVIPVAWAQHDDGNYVGRPYTPYPNFYDKLTEMGCGDWGYGIIHWTTWPLDLYFQSLVRQVWAGSENAPLAQTCAEMARDLIGNGQSDILAAYLYDWVTTMQKVGRETSNYFSDRPIRHPDEFLAELPGVREGYRRRIGRLDRIDLSSLPEVARQRVAYFQGLERFILALYENDAHWLLASRALDAGKPAEARAELAQAEPERVIDDFAAFSQAKGITRGEQGLVVTMNTRWLPYFVQLRQRLGMEAVRVNFGATSHDPLAQSAGYYTFLFGPDRALWETKGLKETGLEVFASQAADLPDNALDRDILQEGIKSPEPFEIQVGAILNPPTDSKAAIPPGDYELSLWFASSNQSTEPQVFRVGVFEKPVAEAGAVPSVYRCPATKAGWLRIVCNGNSENNWNSINEVRCAALRAEQRPTASDQVAGTPPEFAVDGKPDTRWAAQGKGQWLQVELDPRKSFDGLEIDWYGGATRTYDCNFAVSQDGTTWTPLTITSPNPAARQIKRTVRQLLAETITLNSPPGKQRTVQRRHPITLETPSLVQLRFEPLQGEAAVNGISLSPRPHRGDPQ